MSPREKHVVVAGLQHKFDNAEYRKIVVNYRDHPGYHVHFPFYNEFWLMPKWVLVNAKRSRGSGVNDRDPYAGLPARIASRCQGTDCRTWA
jgi:hypothetical protein